MIKSKIVAIIKSRLGNRNDAETAAKIEAELDMAQYQLERFGIFTPWFLLSETATYTTTVGEARVPIPSDMLQEYEEGALFYLNAALSKHDLDYLTEKFNGASGAPVAYALVDNYFQLFPIPDDAYQLSMKYYQEDTVPSAVADNAENKWMKHAADWLMSMTGSAVARFTKDAAAKAEFDLDASAASKRIYTMHVDRAERNSVRAKGDV